MSVLRFISILLVVGPGRVGASALPAPLDPVALVLHLDQADAQLAGCT